MKIVGTRKPASGLKEANQLQKTAQALRGNKPFYPRGVYRFKTHKEAQEWSLRMITRKRKY